MRIAKDIYLVASGSCGLSLTNQLDCNVYLVDCHDGCILVDAGVGDEPERIEEQIISDGFTLGDIKYIVLTHMHADHASGTARFKRLTGAYVAATAHEAKQLGNQEKLDAQMLRNIESGFYYSGYRHIGCCVDRIAEDGDTLSLGDVCFHMIATPGHTAGGLSLYANMDGKDVLFTGDTVTYGGLINLLCVEDADIMAYKNSIERLAAMNVDSLLPGHMQPVLNNGGEQIQKANRIFARLSVPQNIF